MFKFNFEIEEEEIKAAPSILPSSSSPSPSSLSPFTVHSLLSPDPEREIAICGEEEVEVANGKIVKLTFSPSLYSAHSDIEGQGSEGGEGGEGGEGIVVKEEGEGEEERKKREREVIEVAGRVDVKDGLYEGGFKLWECSIDLLHYIASFTEGEGEGVKGEGVKGYWEGKRVFEIGCGHSLPSIYSLLQSPSFVCFQDYNEEVIKKLTMPSVMRNVELFNPSLSPSLPDRTLFVSGDWLFLFKELKEEEKYDVILTSDTLYNEGSLEKLYDLIKRSLKYPTGVAYIAAKVYYFGVGGGVKLFEEIVVRDKVFSCSAVKTFDDGRSNIRQILKLSFLS